MNTWRQEDKQRFMETFDGYWPNSFPLPNGGVVIKSWIDVAQRYAAEIALEALKEIYESQERPRLPTIVAFRTFANQIQAYIDGEVRRRNELALRLTPTFSPQEIAMDDSFWEPINDKAANLDQLNFLKALRKLMTRGACGVHLANFLGDCLNTKFKKACAEKETADAI